MIASDIELIAVKAGGAVLALLVFIVIRKLLLGRYR